MPAQVAKGSVLAALGARLDASVKAHAADEIKSFGQGLPPGIRGGVAKLTGCKFEIIPAGRKNAGAPRLVMQGVALEPQTVVVDGREEQVAGRQTWQFEPICDTENQSGKKTSVDEHVARVIQHLGRLGGRLDPRTASGVGLEQVARALESQSLNGKPIYFHFTTALSDDKSMVFENWNGTEGLEDYAEPDFAAGAVTAAPDEAPDSPPDDAADEQEVDIDALAAEADGMDIAAALAPDGPGTRIVEIAEQLGADVEAVKAANTWADAAEIVKAAAVQEGEFQSVVGTDVPEPVEAWTPKKGDPVGYKAPVKNKAGKLVPGTKVVQCEVAAINKNGTCDLVQLSNKKVGWKGVKLDQVEQLS